MTGRTKFYLGVVGLIGVLLWGIATDASAAFTATRAELGVLGGIPAPHHGAKPKGEPKAKPPAKPKPPAPAPPAPAPPAKQPGPSGNAAADIPAAALAAYKAAVRDYCPQLSWTVLAGIGKVETNHGRSRLPGVTSGVNAFGCCSGPMQFNTHDGPPSTWDAYKVDADHNGTADIYSIRDATGAAARKLCANGVRSPGGRQGLRQAIFGYNHAWWYVDKVLGFAAGYARSRP